jgi:hypothetical protein
MEDRVALKLGFSLDSLHRTLFKLVDFRKVIGNVLRAAAVVEYKGSEVIRVCGCSSTSRWNGTY